MCHGLQGHTLHSSVGPAGRSPRPTAIQGVLGRLECDMFVLQTGLGDVPPVALLPALPLTHTDHLHGDFPCRTFPWLLPVHVLDTLWDEDWVPSRYGQKPTVA